jgi:hypothetical protein
VETERARSLTERLEASYTRRDEAAIATIAAEADAAGEEQVAQTARFYLERIDHPPARALETAPDARSEPASLGTGLRAAVVVCQLLLALGVPVSLLYTLVTAKVTAKDVSTPVTVGIVLGGLAVTAVLISIILVLSLLVRQFPRARQPR